MTKDPRHQGLHWPGWPQLGLALLLGLAQGLWFALIYGGADWLTRQHAYRVQWHSTWDLHIPFVPAAFLAYLSLNVLFWIVPFVLRKRAELFGIVYAMAVATLVAGVCFVALPVAHAYTPIDAADLGNWQPIAEFARGLALEYNYAPSLHVAFTTICYLAMKTYLHGGQRFLWQVWCSVIVISTLLTHQHFLVDVATGLLLGWLTIRYCYRPWLARAAQSTARSTLPRSAADQDNLV